MSFAFSVVYNTAILRPYPSCAPIKAGHIWTRWLGVTYSVILDQKLLSCKAGHFNGRSYNYHSEFGHCIYTALSLHKNSSSINGRVGCSNRINSIKFHIFELLDLRELQPSVNERLDGVDISLSVFTIVSLRFLCTVYFEILNTRSARNSPQT